jgi:NAD(P)-dependent dehydrogenase (short-subunit alcohol dehydrogenase family)
MIDAILQGKSAIVTGANQGLGLEIARVYAQAGASLLICARNPDLLQAAQQEFSQSLLPGQTITAVAADVSNGDSVNSLVERALQRFGPIC